jgi:hypothetical protein
MHRCTYRSVLRQPCNENILWDAINHAVHLQNHKNSNVTTQLQGSRKILAIRPRSHACLISVVRIHPELPHERMPSLHRR